MKQVLFRNWYKSIKWTFLFPVSKNVTKIYVRVKGFTYAKNKFHHR